MNAVSLHRVAKINRTGDIVLVIGKRFGHTFANGFERSKVNYRIEVVFLKDGVQASLIQQVNLEKRDLFPRERADSLQRFLRGIAEIIYDENLMTGIQELQTRMAADIPSTPR